jgi:hypothetical protein
MPLKPKPKQRTPPPDRCPQLPSKRSPPPLTVYDDRARSPTRSLSPASKVYYKEIENYWLEIEAEYAAERFHEESWREHQNRLYQLQKRERRLQRRQRSLSPSSKVRFHEEDWREHQNRLYQLQQRERRLKRRQRSLSPSTKDSKGAASISGGVPLSRPDPPSRHNEAPGTCVSQLTLGVAKNIQASNSPFKDYVIANKAATTGGSAQCGAETQHETRASLEPAVVVCQSHVIKRWRNEQASTGYDSSPTCSPESELHAARQNFKVAMSNLQNLYDSVKGYNNFTSGSPRTPVAHEYIMKSLQVKEQGDALKTLERSLVYVSSPFNY